MKLIFNALIKYVFGVLLVGALVFLPAGTLLFTGGLVFMTVLFVPVFILGVVLLIKFPKLLEKRLDGKEKQGTQKVVVALSALIFIGGFVVAGLDYRFGWSRVPTAVQIVAVLLFLCCYGLYAEVMRENAYLSRTVEVQEGQKVVDTGLYGIVRHPMYTATALMFLMIPIILGSIYACIIFLAYPIIIAMRIKAEEKLLSQQLEGYKEYKRKVKYKMIPFIW